MLRRSFDCVLFCGVASLAACGSDSLPANPAQSMTAGAAGMPSGTSGSAGTPQGGSGQAQAGTVGQTGGASGSSGASTGGAGGSASGAGGVGGDPNVPTLPKRVLLYHFSTLEIASVPAQLTSLTGVLEGWGYEVEVSEAPSAFTTTNLARFGAVAMINTCFEPFGAGQAGTAESAALAQFVESGGGLFGTHCATVTFRSVEPPPAYNQLIGGRSSKGFFEGASACRTLEAHPTTMELPATFDYNGNLDDADFLAPDTKVLVKCKWSGNGMIDTAVSWYRTQGKGRVFYSNFAKEDTDLKDPVLGTKHLFVGLSWVLWR